MSPAVLVAFRCRTLSFVHSPGNYPAPPDLLSTPFRYVSDALPCDGTSGSTPTWGTCQIGTDGQAVVDTDLRVLGISGFRMADASVMSSPLPQ